MKKLLLIILTILLIGCTPTKYSENIEKDVIAKGQTVLEPFLDEMLGEHRDLQYYMFSGAKEGQGIYSGYYASNIVGANFKYGEKFSTAAVDLETGKIYVDILKEYFLELINNDLAAMMEAGQDYQVKMVDISFTNVLTSHNIKSGKETINTTVELENMVPIDINNENHLDYLSQIIKTYEGPVKMAIDVYSLEELDEEFIGKVEEFLNNLGIEFCYQEILIRNINEEDLSEFSRYSAYLSEGNLKASKIEENDEKK